MIKIWKTLAPLMFPTLSWLVVFAIHGAVHLKSVLATELYGYEKDWGFILFGFAYSWGLYYLAAWIVTLFITAAWKLPVK